MLDRATVRVKMDALEEAIRAKASELGLNVEKVSGSFSATDLNLRVKMTDASDDAQEKLSDRADHEAELLGLNKKVGDSFTTWGGKTYTITGINLRRRKYPVSVEGPQGGRYKMTVAQVNAGEKVAA